MTIEESASSGMNIRGLTDSIIVVIVSLIALVVGPAALAQEPAGTEKASEATATAGLESYFAQNEGVRIHYVAGGRGPLVVLVHGFADYSATWDLLWPELIDDYRVAAMDLRGYNLSDAPDEPNAYAMETLIADVFAVVEAEGYESATLIGHDWGAAIGWRAAISEPERIDGLAALSMPHPAAYALDLANNPEQLVASRYSAPFLSADTMGRFAPGDLAGWVGEPQRRADYFEAFERSDVSSMTQFFRVNEPAASRQEMADTRDLEINLPLLIVHGVEDGWVLVSGHDNTFDYVSSDSAMLRVPGAGHVVHRDAPAVVNESIRSWLDLHRD